MTASPAVSVIVPAFNAGAWLADCVDSVLHQTMPDLELIIVDDGSTDGCVEALKRHPDDRLTVIRQSNSGAAAARNAGLDHARGTWICFVDADDLLAPDKLQKQLSYLDQRPGLELCGGEWIRFHDAPPSAADSNRNALWSELDPVTWQVIALEHNLMMQPAAWIASHRLVKRAGGWDQRLSLNDDGEFFARLMLECEKVGFCDGALSFYRSGVPGSLSSGKQPHHFDSALLALEQIADLLLRREDSCRTRSALARACSRLAVEAYPFHLPGSQKAASRANQLGRFDPRFAGGPAGRLVASVVGWRLARQLQNAWYRLAYRRSATRHVQDPKHLDQRPTDGP